MAFTALDPESNQAINDAMARRAGGAAPTPALDQNTQSPTAAPPMPAPVTGTAAPSGMPQMKKPLTENESNRKIILGAMKGELERIGKSEEMAQGVPMA